MVRKAANKKPREKKRYLDGELEFKSKSLLDYHLELKQEQAEGLIESFAVPQVNEMKNTGRIKTYKITINGYTFDSMDESKYYIYLLKQKRVEEIKEIVLQPRYEIQSGFRKLDKLTGKQKAIRKIEYVADFLVVDKNNETVIYDVKGQLTDVFKLKRKMFDCVFPELFLTCIKLDSKLNEWVTV